MSYRVEILPTALKSLKQLNRQIIHRILDKISWLAENFNSVNHIPLRGEFSDLYKLRIGDYRVIYSFDREKSIITVHLIGHRKDIYKESK